MQTMTKIMKLYHEMTKHEIRTMTTTLKTVRLAFLSQKKFILQPQKINGLKTNSKQYSFESLLAMKIFHIIFLQTQFICEILVSKLLVFSYEKSFFLVLSTKNKYFENKWKKYIIFLVRRKG